jgi:formate hydrogenlyase subunit 3/multisubunit Na+/H+ antiporter MnhD subunit
MVGPIVLIAVPLAVAFLYPLFERIDRRAAVGIALAVLASLFAITVRWSVALVHGATEFVSQTAGFLAPLSINLAVGPGDATVLATITGISIAALAAVSVGRSEPWRGKQIVLLFVLLLGSYGLVMTRDLFNIFVFMEISGIAIFGMLSTSHDGRAFEAGFKYMIASGLASAFFLIGTAFIYRRTGTLNIDGMTDLAATFTAGAGVLALLILAAGILVELKPAPANGWALDVYQAADSEVGALLSGVNATAMVVVLSRLLPLFFGAAADLFRPLLLVAGIVAFLVPQVQALLQESTSRLLGYSSVAQIGLAVVALVVAPRPVAFLAYTVPAAVVLLLNHAIAKAGLFWILAATGDDATGASGRWPRSFRNRPDLLVITGVLVCAILGLPPFPGFWAKWNLVIALGGDGSYLLMAAILAGSLFEAVYLLRWFVGMYRNEHDEVDVLGERIPRDFEREETAQPTRSVPPVLAPTLAVASIAAGVLASLGMIALLGLGLTHPIVLAVASLAAFAFLDAIRVPTRVQVVIAIAAIGWYASRFIPTLDGVARLFALIFAAGAAVQMIALLARGGRRAGLPALIVGLVGALLALTTAATGIELFLAWEVMTLTSYLLISRGFRAGAASLRYIVFSLASAYLMLAAIALVGPEFSLASVAGTVADTAPAIATWSAILLALAVVIKLGSIGVHIWLPSAYAEAEDEVSSLASSVLSKAGVFVLFAGATFFAVPVAPGIGLPAILGWVGVATAIVGAMMALFQEDIKYTLAYSSMSQIGYIVLSFAAMSHLGWVSGLYLAVTHMIFKAILFLAIAGVIARVGTRLMYRMGGLIKVMPFSFVSVLIAIIAVSGVPPLSGFGGKWLLYTALLERGWYLQTALALFSSGIAFLYLFRLIHSIFLGQRKAIHDEVREAPFLVLLPQYILIVAIMAISMFPNILIVPLQRTIESVFASTVTWDGYAVISSLGYWNGNAVMYVTMGVFLAPLVWLLLVKGRVYRVRQFNIVYAAERPLKPETTHYAYNFFGHYRKAFGRLLDPWGERLWRGVSASVRTLSHALRAWNTGNPQTYAFQIMLYLFLTYLVVGGGL